jgi:putative acetyltransferase
MKIEKMVIAEYSHIKRLWCECELSDEPEDSKEDIDALLKSSQGTGFVAKDKGNIIGAVLCGSDGRYGYIHHLAVSKVMRKKGIGKALIDECLLFLKRRHVIIMVRKNNETGNEFWNHLQFKNADWVKIQFIRTE